MPQCRYTTRNEVILMKNRIFNSVITLVVLTFICMGQAIIKKKQHQQSTKTNTGNLTTKMVEKFIGTWKLVSTEGRPSGEKLERKPTGYIIYDSNGHVYVQIMLRNDRTKFISDGLAKATTEEKAAAYDSYVAYYGTYTINEAEGIIMHHVEGSLDPNEVGNDLIRYFEFSGNRITLIPTRLAGGKLIPKSELSRRLTWERVK